MFNTPGGPQQQLIQHLARAYGGVYPNLPASSPTSYSTGLDGSFSSPGQMTPFGAFHFPADPEGNPDANSGNVGAIAAGSHLNPGGPMRPAYGSGDVKSILQALLGQHTQENYPQRLPDRIHQQPWDVHHGMINAASEIAKALAQHHTGGLRRYQY
jgi:hypothetical protein